jgi:hypothetical protein
VHAPDGTAAALPRDPAAGDCAAAWPTQPGWHEVHDGGRVLAFAVRDRDTAPGLAAAGRREATAALAAQAVTATAAAAPAPRPGPRWPWALAWLAIAAAVWALERARAGTKR